MLGLDLGLWQCVCHELREWIWASCGRHVKKRVRQSARRAIGLRWSGRGLSDACCCQYRPLGLLLKCTFKLIFANLRSVEEASCAE